MTIAKITGIGVWLPPQVRLNDEWPQGFGQRGGGERTFNDIAAPKDQRAAAIVAADPRRGDRDPFLGAVRRHVADDATTSDDAETYAATAALADAGVEGKDINLILANSVVPERIGAYGGLTTSHRIGAKDAQAVGVETACAAASVTQLENRRAYIQAGMASTSCAYRRTCCSGQWPWPIRRRRDSAMGPRRSSSPRKGKA